MTNSIDSLDLLTPARYETMEKLVQEVFAKQEKSVAVSDDELVPDDN